MNLQGKELTFISRIVKTGKAVIDVTDEDMSRLDNDTFQINCLSISEQTFIASGFGTYVVKIKSGEKYTKFGMK